MQGRVGPGCVGTGDSPNSTNQRSHIVGTPNLHGSVRRSGLRWVLVEHGLQGLEAESLGLRGFGVESFGLCLGFSEFNDLLFSVSQAPPS